MPKRHFELHYAERIGWLRAAVLGANIAVGAGRATLWGVLAMAITAAAGAMFGSVP